MLSLLIVLAMQIARTTFPIVYEASEDGDVILAGLGGIAVYLAPILALALTRLSPSRDAAIGGGLVVTARLALQFVHPIPLWMTLTATGAALLGVAVTLVAARRRLDGLGLTYAIVIALALDAALRAPFRTWDLVWQRSLPAILVTLALVGTAVAVGAAAASSPPRPGGSHFARVWAVGPYLMLQVLFLQNAGYIGSQTSVSFATASLVLLAGDTLAIVAALGLRSHAAILVVLALQTCLTVALALGLSATRSVPSSRIVVGLTVGTFAFAAFTYLWQVDIQLPLPFPRVFVPMAAATLVGVSALHAGSLPQGLWPRRAGVMTAPLLLATILVPGWLWLASPNEQPRSATAPVLRLVSFNVRGAVGTDGMVDANAVADAIVRADPDIVLLQEVARGWIIHGASDLLAYLHDRLQMPYAFQPAGDGQFGNAIFTRLASNRVAAGPLPELAGKQRRSYIAIDVRASGTELLVIDAHLEGGSSAQIDALLDAWGGAAPAVVGGDMNLKVADEERVRRFTDLGLIDVESATGDPCRPTSAEPAGRCDRPSWVFVTNDIDIHAFRIGEPSASDHLPISMTLSVHA